MSQRQRNELLEFVSSYTTDSEMLLALLEAKAHHRHRGSTKELGNIFMEGLCVRCHCCFEAGNYTVDLESP